MERKAMHFLREHALPWCRRTVQAVVEAAMRNVATPREESANATNSTR